jgi:hypothetical protein
MKPPLHAIPAAAPQLLAPDHLDAASGGRWSKTATAGVAVVGGTAIYLGAEKLSDGQQDGDFRSNHGSYGPGH